MLGGSDPLLLILSVLLLSAVLVGLYLLLGRMLRLEPIPKQAGRFAKWRFVVDFLVWAVILINISFYINGWLGKGITLLVGIAVALRIELARANARTKSQANPQSKSQSKSPAKSPVKAHRKPKKDS